MPLQDFHPAVRRWFERALGQPTQAQQLAWPAARQGRHTLIAAPTGSGKTLAAFLAAIDGLLREGLEQGHLEDETRILYISPLKALSNDVQKNLELPLAGIRDALLESGLHDVPIRSWVRTGDTPAGERERMRRQPPHILVTTPESLYILLTSASGRTMLSTVRTVIVDEIHALAGNKRGAHLALSLERLSALCGREPVRIGLSATQKPIADMARFLTGGSPNTDCVIVDTGHTRQRDLAIEVPDSPLEAVMAAEVWAEIYDRLAALVASHRTTLIFVNTRRLAERAARHLAERLEGEKGAERVAAHHGSMAREQRLDAEQRLKQGKLSVLVATASLELGIDIGDVDLVCQLGSPRAISVFLQRVGRSGHAVGGLPKGRLFPLSRDELVECVALLEAVQRGELDRIRMPRAPLDVLAQHIVGEVASREWEEDALYERMRRALPFADLTHAQFTEVLRMLADGYSTRRARRGAYLHRDVVNGRLRARRGARLTALTNAGAIPDQFDYDVILQPQGYFVGTLNEDFAFESLPGDVFQLGNTSYRMLKIEQGKVLVEDAKGQPPNIPFWLGEAPGRSDELSQAVSRLRESAEARLTAGDDAHALTHWLSAELALTRPAAEQLAVYFATAYAALGALPSAHKVVVERFFDEVGDMHLVIHAPFGARINRAWGLALRKRFCRKFNFELQAAATENNIVLSLGPTHSFALDEVAHYLRSASARHLLIQALLDAPMFATRWRWVTNIALAVPRNRNGRRVPAQFQRADAEDLVAVVFPDQLACFENIQGEREVPDHPLVNQTLTDCLHEVMDIDGFEAVLRGIESGKISVLARDLTVPSPFACEILAAKPYAFLDDAPAEERRTLAVQQRRTLDPQTAADLGRLDPEAIARVRAEAWPQASSADELHDALVLMGLLTAADMQRRAHWETLFEMLVHEGRATRVSATQSAQLLAAAERMPEVRALYPGATETPVTHLPAHETAQDTSSDAALVSLLRSRLEGEGPTTAALLATQFALDENQIRAALTQLEGEGFAAPAAAWEAHILPARVRGYYPDELDRLCSSGRFAWLRLIARKPIEPSDSGARKAAPLRATPIAFVPRRSLAPWRFLNPVPEESTHTLSADARTLANAFAQYPAAFFEELKDASGLLHTRLETALAELAAFGFVSADSYAGLRALIAPQHKRPSYSNSRRRRQVSAPRVEEAGRWVWLRPQTRGENTESTATSRSTQSVAIEHIARALLRRYGVVFRALLARESGAPPWRDLVQCYRRLEARGEIRGGRFVDGFSGEQYALPEAVSALRDIRRKPDSEHGDFISLSAADPLNLTGIITPGERVSAQTANRVLYRDGVPVAHQTGSDVRYLENPPAEREWEWRTALLRAEDKETGEHHREAIIARVS
ncbi:MAG: DEAD/DEAH box helicase [Chromatiales bacterium]|jgi:ATP-dependent Lhr-like helicase|nr:DEAD/DEAH box helicase [Chromatiales bacterium]